MTVLVKLGRDIHAILVIEYWSLQKSILPMLQNEGKVEIAISKEWHRFRFGDKKKKYQKGSSTHNRILITIKFTYHPVHKKSISADYRVYVVQQTQNFRY